MPIEFPCQQCGQTLRVPDDAAGKMARCPKCSFVSSAPGGPAPPPTPVGPTPPPSSYPAATDPHAAGGAATDSPATRNPFAAGANPFRDDHVTTPSGSPNPYQSPTLSSTTPGYTPEMIRTRVLGPAIGLIVIGSLNLLLLGLMIVGLVAQSAENGLDQEDLTIFSIALLLFLVKSVPLIYGGVQMMKLRSYAAALTAVVISFVPCCYCYIIELPIAIWAVVVLSDYQIRAAFRKGEPGLMKTQPTARAAGDLVTLNHPIRPEASAFGSREAAFSSAQG